jgi:hypothetical protein
MQAGITDHVWGWEELLAQVGGLTMRKFILGVVVGLSLGMAVSVFADGFLIGWAVTLNGNIICEDPYMWNSIKEIECS